MYGVISRVPDIADERYDAHCPECGIRICRAYNSRAAFRELEKHNDQVHP